MTDEESEKEYWYKHSATLRIRDKELDFDEISRTLGLEPTYSHRKSITKVESMEQRMSHAWHYETKLDEELPLSAHLDALWEVLKPHADYVRSLKKKHKVDIFCGYRSNNTVAGFTVDYRSLDIFTELELPFEVSVIVF